MGLLIIKVPRSPLHPFPESPGHPKSMNKLTLNEPAITLMQPKVHCRKHIKYKTAKQRPDEITTAKSNTQQYKYKQQTTCR